MQMFKSKKLMTGGVLVLLILLVTVITVLGGGEPVMRRSIDLSDTEIPSDVLMWVAENKQFAGYNAFGREDRVYVVARLGQRPTGGYSVHLGEPELEGRVLYVKVEIQEPKPWDMVTQALTYPSRVIGLRFEGQLPETVVFLSVRGDELARVEVVYPEDPGEEESE